MLEARKSRWFENVFSIYNRSLLRRRFNSLRVSGLDNLKSNSDEENLPILICANHSSWWDGLIAFQISHAAKLDAYVMMEEKQLSKLRIFRRLGAFSVVREKPFEAYKSVRYAANLLNQNPVKCVWIFPQGEILPNDLRPIKFSGGVTKILKMTEKVKLISLAFKIEFLGNYKPDILVEVGQPQVLHNESKHTLSISKSMMEKDLTRLLDTLKDKIINQNFQSFENLL